jgi:hypothetical protein
MEFKGKYKQWYERLLKANCNECYAKQKVEKFLEMDDEKIWVEKLKEFIKKGDKPNEALEKVKTIRKVMAGEDIWERAVRIVEFNRERDLVFLKKAIPKEQLEDGAWYDCENEAKKVARFQGHAKWVKEKDMFLAPGQQQFGTDGWLNHWEDVVDIRLAGFVPMWKVE